jgi:hypothetical protein
VVIECSKNMKKSKVEWRLPSLLLYRYCYDSYQTYVPYYREALSLGMLPEEEVEKFEMDVSQIKDTMLLKILPVARKKVEISPQIRTLVESPQKQPEVLEAAINSLVLKFIESLIASSELEDPNIARCGLLMVNAVYIIRKLTKDWDTPVLERVEEVEEDELEGTFAQWAKRLQKILKA